MGDLTGFTVGVTADRRWREQAALFERRGAGVLHGAAIATSASGAEGPLRIATDDLLDRPPDVLVANTAVGIRSWFAAAESWGAGDELRRALSGALVYARGPKAAGAAHSAGLEVAVRAASERMSEVVALLREVLRPGSRVAFQLDGSASVDAVEALRAAGAEVVAVPVYRWAVPDDRSAPLRLVEAILSGRVHAVTFTAGPAVRNLLAIAGDVAATDDLRRALGDGRVVVGCVGPVCAEIAAEEGISPTHVVQPDAYRLGPLVRVVEERLLAGRLTVRTASALLTISGNAVLADGACLHLSATEARLLATLAARPNVVHSKDQLLRTVWSGSPADEHTVEVGIARLRKRLGPHGNAIRSVRRRGYTLRS